VSTTAKAERLRHSRRRDGGHGGQEGRAGRGTVGLESRDRRASRSSSEDLTATVIVADTRHGEPREAGKGEDCGLHDGCLGWPGWCAVCKRLVDEDPRWWKLSTADHTRTLIGTMPLSGMDCSDATSMERPRFVGAFFPIRCPTAKLLS
jgi:hypothetical protein